VTTTKDACFYLVSRGKPPLHRILVMITAEQITCHLSHKKDEYLSCDVYAPVSRFDQWVFGVTLLGIVITTIGVIVALQISKKSLKEARKLKDESEYFVSSERFADALWGLHQYIDKVYLDKDVDPEEIIEQGRQHCANLERAKHDSNSATIYRCMQSLIQILHDTRRTELWLFRRSQEPQNEAEKLLFDLRHEQKPSRYYFNMYLIDTAGWVRKIADYYMSKSDQADLEKTTRALDYAVTTFQVKANSEVISKYEPTLEEWLEAN